MNKKNLRLGFGKKYGENTYEGFVSVYNDDGVRLYKIRTKILRLTQKDAILDAQLLSDELGAENGIKTA